MDVQHECDLFLMTSHYPYYGDNILAEFARQGIRNMDGWGIAGYNNGKVKIIKSAEPAVKSNSHNVISNEFAVAIDSISGEVVLGHLRLTSMGKTIVENNHNSEKNSCQGCFH